MTEERLKKKKRPIQKDKKDQYIRQKRCLPMTKETFQVIYRIYKRNDLFFHVYRSRLSHMYYPSVIVHFRLFCHVHRSLLSLDYNSFFVCIGLVFHIYISLSFIVHCSLFCHAYRSFLSHVQISFVKIAGHFFHMYHMSLSWLKSFLSYV